MADPLPGVRDPAHRVDLYCASCGAYDKHPRHVTILDMERGTYLLRHFDCCHNAGCSDGSCTRHLAASGNAHGDDLIAYLEERQRG